MATAPSITVRLPGHPFSNLTSVPSLSILRARSSGFDADGDNLVVDYGAFPGDGGGGLYAWQASSVATDDGRGVIRPNDTTPLQAGRWVLVDDSSQRFFDFIATLGGAGGAAEIGFQQAGSGAVVRNLLDKARETFSVLDFIPASEHAAIFAGTSTYDAGPAIQAADTAAAGRVLNFPHGTLRVVTPVVCYNPDAGVYTLTSKWHGAGRGKTILINEVSGAPMISVKSSVTPVSGAPSTFRGMTGFQLRDMTIRRGGTATGQTALYLRAAFYASVQHVSFENIAGTVIRVECTAGDTDASNTLLFDDLLMLSCTGRAFDIGDTNHNEVSYVTIRQCRIESCGSGLTNGEGVVKWKGQILRFEQSAIVTCTAPVGFEIPGGPGSAQQALLSQVTFENNKSVDCKVYGIFGFDALGCQIYHSDGFVGGGGFVFDASTFLISKVNVSKTTVRATIANNSFVAFSLSGANAQYETCRVDNTIWDNFDYPGQTRFFGWRFDPVPMNCTLVVNSATDASLRPTRGTGNFTPLRLRGPGGGTGKLAFTTSGEWVAADVTAVSLPMTGLANNTTPYVYLYDNNGAKALRASTTAPAVDAATGYMVAGGDVISGGDGPTMLYVGRVAIDNNGQFLTTGTGWLNATAIASTQVGVFSYLWTDGTGRLRIKVNTRPTSDTDGDIVGVQAAPTP